MNTSTTRRWKELETLTGIPAANWLAAVRNKQRPTADMIEAVARAWPQYAYWLVTGSTDARYGHVCADTYAQIARTGRQFYPELSTNAVASTAAYLKLNLDLYRAKYEDHPYVSPDQEEELYTRHQELALERLSQIEAVIAMQKAHLQEIVAQRQRSRLTNARDDLEWDGSNNDPIRTPKLRVEENQIDPTSKPVPTAKRKENKKA